MIYTEVHMSNQASHNYLPQYVGLSLQYVCKCFVSETGYMGGASNRFQSVLDISRGLRRKINLIFPTPPKNIGMIMCSVVQLWPAQLLCPWNFPDKNILVGGAISYSRGSSQPRARIPFLVFPALESGFFITSTTWGALA